MAQMTVLLEGSLKYRDGKKWKPRWCVVRKLSPAADRLHIALYKNARERFRNVAERRVLAVEDLFAVCAGVCVGGERHTLALVCQLNTTLLAFQNSQTRGYWELALRTHLGEEVQFPGLRLVKSPSKSKLVPGVVTLYVQGSKFGLSTNTLPPKILAHWRLSDVRKFGVIDGKFCFQAGSQCDKLSGVFAFESDEAHRITEALQEATKKANQGRTHRNSESASSRQSSQSSLPSFQCESLPRDFRRKNFSNTQVYADHNFEPDVGTARGQGPGLVRCATTSAADYQPSGTHRRPRGRDVTQSTPNFHHSRKLVKKPPPDTVEESEPPPEKAASQNSAKQASSADSRRPGEASVKSRRYSSGDLYLSRLRQRLQLARLQRLGGFGASAAALPAQSGQPSALRSQSVVDITEFHASVQKTLSVLPPRSGEHSVSALQEEVLRHGAHGSTSTLNLSQVLCVGSEDRLAAGSSSSERRASGVSLCDLSPAGCGRHINCKCCSNSSKLSHSALSLHSNRVEEFLSHSASLSKLPPAMADGGLHTLSPGPAGQRPFTGTGSSGSVTALSPTASVSPLNSPLHFVDLRRYDGVEESANAHYQNGGSLHGSLQRPARRRLVQNYSVGHNMPSGSHAGDYVILKTDSQATSSPPPRPCRRPRGTSLDNILERLDPGPNYTNLGPEHSPASLLSTVVPAHLASYSKEDLLHAITKHNGTVADTPTSPDYQPMNLKPRQASDNPGTTREPEYMLMDGTAAKNVTCDNSVFCSVELPKKQSSESWRRTASFSCSPRSNAAALTSNPQSQEDSYLDMSHPKQSIHHSATEPAYLDMSFGQNNRRSSLSVRSPASNKDKLSRAGNAAKHFLQHSKSLDNELDEPYLDMNFGNRRNSGEYLAMNHGTGTGVSNREPAANRDINIYANTEPFKPFDNLIKHNLCYNKPKEYAEVSSSSLSTSSVGKPSDLVSYSGDKSSSEDDNHSQKSGKSNKSTPSKKSSNLLSRLMKRSSLKSKDKSKLKQSRSTQEFSSADSSSSSDRRLSMQPPASAPRVTGNRRQSTSSDSALSAGSLVTSTPSGSPADSGLVALSAWRLGPPIPRPATAPTQQSTHLYVNEPTPPERPPKTYTMTCQRSNNTVHSPTHTDNKVAPAKTTLLATVDENSAENASDTRNKSATDDDEVFLDNKPVLPPAVRPRKNPNLTVNIEQPENSRLAHLWRDTNVSPFGRRPVSAPAVSPGEGQHARRLRSSSTRSSSSSCDSSCCDDSQHSGHHVSSPGITTMRPRFGKEYQRINRHKLAEQLNMPLPGGGPASPAPAPVAEPSPADTNVFNFEFPAATSSRHHSTSEMSASGSSPRYPVTRHREPAYVNLSFSRTSSPGPSGHPHSPGARSNMSEDMSLNYAEIDLTDSGRRAAAAAPSVACGRSASRKGTVDYAVIDMVATAAISRVGREQAQLREDKLVRDGLASRHAGSVTLPTPARERRSHALGRSNSTSSRDRKL